MVDAGVAIHRLVLLCVLDQTRDRAVDGDRETRFLALACSLPAQVLLVGTAPPARDAGLGLDFVDGRHVVGRQRAQHDAVSS